MARSWLDAPTSRVGRTCDIASAALFRASGAPALVTGSIVAAGAGHNCRQ